MNRKKKLGAGRTVYIIIAEVLYVLLGVVLRFIPGIELVHICYGLSILLIFAGIVFVVRYFMKESYRNLNEYGFSVGILGVILGICALIRVELWVKSFLPVLGLALLLMAVIKIQYAMDLKSMKDKLWILGLLFAALLTGGAVCVVIDPFKEEQTRLSLLCYQLILDGALGVVENIYLYIRLRIFERSRQESESCSTSPFVETENIDEIPDNFDVEG